MTAGMPGARYSPMPGLVQPGEQRIGGHPGSSTTWANVRYRSNSTVVADSASVISLGRVLGEPGREQPGEHIAVPVAVAFVAEVDTERLAQAPTPPRRCPVTSTRSRKCLPVNVTTMNATPSRLVKS